MNVSTAIQVKRAVRQFSDQPLAEEISLAILNAGRRSQSSKNTQPWNFIAIQDKSTLEKLSTLGTYAGHISGAALAIGLITPPPETRFSIMFDAGQSAAYMQLAAWELGVASCLATIYQPDAARQLLGFPEDLTMLIAISFGYPLDAAVLTAKPRKGGRRPLDELLHWEKW
jgi:nitroreductase